MRALTPTAAALTLLATSAGAAKAKPRDAILLSQVESLTLRADKQTTHRRVPAVPQLKCVSPQAVCSKYKVDVMRCENKGSGYDDEDVQWSCSASLPPELKLGSTDVICEGYSSPGDPYVLKGSCAVEYRMSLTREGEEKWPDLGGGDGFDSGGTGLAGWVFWVIFFSVLAFIVYNAFINSRRGAGGNAPRRNNGGGYWGGGGGGGGFDDFGNDDPPPPYPGTNNHSNKSRRAGGSSAQRGGSAQQGWRPDWWSAAGGAAAGAAAGYGAGRTGRNNNNTNNRGYGNYGSTWGSGGGPSRSGSSGSSSGSAVSNSRYESTGFGSTSRR